MSRRTAWIAVALFAVATAGFLFAVLVPRNSDELPPPGVTIEKTIIIPPGVPDNCSQASTTSSGETIDPTNSGCASIEIRLDGTCVVDFPVDDKTRRDLAAQCPNGVEQR